MSILDGFLSRATLARLVGEAEQLAGFGHASDVPGTPYLELPSDHWPSGHPRTTWSHTKLTAISYDKFPSDSALRKLYESDAFLAFLRAALGFDIYRYDDPLGGLNIAAMYDGDELAWHFDQTDFVVSIAIQSSERGGEFECAPRIRSAED